MSIANRILACKDLNNIAAVESPGAAHAMGTATLLCGNKMQDQRRLDNGISIDQAIANTIGGGSRFASVQWSSGEPGPCDVGGSACAHTQSISWAGADQPLAPQIRPDVAFNQLFGTTLDGLEGQAATTRRANLKSVLDAVIANTQSLTQDLGAEDKSRLDQFFTGVREVETRLQEVRLDCRVGGVPADFGAYAKRVDAFLDLITLALSCGQTKVITYMIEFGLSGRSHPFINAPGGHHALSHFSNEDQKQQLRQLEIWQNANRPTADEISKYTWALQWLTAGRDSSAGDFKYGAGQ